MEREPSVGGSWNEHYLANPRPWTRPDPDLVAEVARLPPGRALDLGCGEGADSLWLAAAGWQVTAVDYAPAAITTLESLAEQRGLVVETVLADLFAYVPQPSYDLVCLCYLHVAPGLRSRLLPMASSALAVGGSLLYIGITRPVRPNEADLPAELLALPEEIVGELPNLDIVRRTVRRRSVGCRQGELEADVMVIRAVRPGRREMRRRG